MITNILFDLDGVLFEGVDFHKEMFLNALYNVCPHTNITTDFHNTVLNGLSTKQKLDFLLNRGIITKVESIKINQEKINKTREGLNAFQIKNTSIVSIVQYLKNANYKLYCVSNSIRDTCETVLKRLGIDTYFTGIVSNEDIRHPKPSPEPYLHAFQTFGLNPYECIILEDSQHGRTAAYKTRAHVLPIVDTLDVTLSKILHEIEKTQMPRHIQDKQHVNIVVPMAGHGSRFSKVGYTVPKPFIPVFGKPMIQWVIENIMPKDETYDDVTIQPNIIPHFHFVAQAEHLKQYDLGKICRSLNIDYTITTVDKVTEGPACTVLLTKQHINTNDPLITINSDQYLDWNVGDFYKSLLNPEVDGCINTFHQPNQQDLKWSYAKLDEQGYVTEVAEKKYISDLATTGIYGWKRGSDFVRCAEEMIAENVRVNNEFYVCPVYNWLIKDGGKVRTYNCKKLWGLGVPEDLDHFLQFYPTQ
jgi:HAD superfamily hydrolase (TIGR01509 family)